MLQNVAGLAYQPGNILQHTFGFMRYGLGVGPGVGVGIPVGAGVGIGVGVGILVGAGVGVGNAVDTGVGVGVGVGIPVGAGVGVKIGTGVKGRLLPQAANVLREQPSIRSCQLLEVVVITRICCNFVCELLPLPLTLTTA